MRRDFSFNVVTFPNLRSNIPNSQAYLCFIYRRIHRICISCSSFIDFKGEARILGNKLKNQNFNIYELKKRICSFIKSKPACFHTFCNAADV